MTCLPCQKEIVDSFAGVAWSTTNQITEKIPSLVKAGRLDPSKAKEILQALIDADNAYIDAVQKASQLFSDSVVPEF